MNTLPNVYKLFHFNLNTSPLYLVKLKITQKQPTAYAVHSVEPIVPDFRIKSFNVRFLLYLLENFFSSLLTENLWHSRGFYQKFIFKLNKMEKVGNENKHSICYCLGNKYTPKIIVVGHLLFQLLLKI